jgi:hypothetical protein
VEKLPIEEQAEILVNETRCRQEIRYQIHCSGTGMFIPDPVSGSEKFVFPDHKEGAKNTYLFVLTRKLLSCFFGLNLAYTN